MSQFTDIINEKKPTLVDFYATWCGPCKMQGPIIEEVKAAVGDEANVLKIDVDRNPELAAQYRGQSVPSRPGWRDTQAYSNQERRTIRCSYSKSEAACRRNIMRQSRQPFYCVGIEPAQGYMKQSIRP